MGFFSKGPSTKEIEYQVFLKIEVFFGNPYNCNIELFNQKYPEFLEETKSWVYDNDLNSWGRSVVSTIIKRGLLEKLQIPDHIKVSAAEKLKQSIPFIK